MISLIIFDMAGTTINEDNVVYKTIRAALQDFGIHVTLEEVLLHGAGKEKKQAINDILEHINDQPASQKEISSIYHSFQKKLHAAYQKSPMRLFAGVPETLQLCRENGIKTVFNTGYSRSVAQDILEKVGIEIGRDIDLLITADDVSLSRPAPDMILLACNLLGISPGETIKIGDSQIDIEEGKNAGVRFSIGITTGAQGREILAGSKPDFILDRIHDLVPILLG